MSARQKRIRTAVFLLAAIILAGIAYSFLANRGPRYQGKSVSYWFDKVCRPDDFSLTGPTRLEAEAALKAMGTDALPYLVKIAFGPEKDSSLRKMLIEMGKEYPDSRSVPHLTSHEDRRRFAAYAVQAIRPRAEVLLPLVRPYLGERNSSQYAQATDLLRAAPTNGQEMLAPIIARALQTTNDELRSRTLGWLNSRGSKATAALPQLVAFIDDRSVATELRVQAAWALASIGDRSDPVIVALQALFTEATNNWISQCQTAAALCKLDANQPNAFSFLTNALANDKEPQKVAWAASELKFVGTNARPAIPVLLEAMTRTNGLAWKRVIITLEELKVSSDAYLPAIKHKLRSEDEELRFEAAKAVLKAEASNDEALQIILQELKSGASKAAEALWAITAAGTNASSAIPVVLELLQTDASIAQNSVGVWDICRALKAMGFSEPELIVLLRKKLTSTDKSGHFAAATVLLSFSPSDNEAKTFLMSQIGLKSPHVEEAISALVKAGAREGIPLFYEALKSENPDVRMTAVRAIRQMEAKENPK